MNPLTCSHCNEVMRGNAGLTTDGVHHHLCHPDEGLDCFRLVTVYRHPLQHCPCVNGHMLRSDYTDGRDAYVGQYMSIDDAIESVRIAYEGRRGDDESTCESVPR